MDIQIRRVTIADVAVLARLARETFYVTFTGTCTHEDMECFLDENYNEEKLSAELQDEELFCFFAELGGEPVAYLQYKEDYKIFPEIKRWKALELKRIYVLKAFHGKGIAQKLMDHYTNFARDNKYEVAWLGVWEHNERALKFYEKNGFSRSGFTHYFPIGNTPQTDVWLWKFLN